MKAKERKQAKADFLASLAVDPNISLACDKALISRDTAYRWKSSDKAFSKKWGEALERCNDVARSSIYGRGIIGWDEQVVSMGQVVYEMEQVLDNEGKPVNEKGKPLLKKGKPLVVRKWSDSLAMGYAKANLPEYKEKQQIDLYQHMAGQAEQDKQSLLADLDAAIANERKKPE